MEISRWWGEHFMVLITDQFKIVHDRKMTSHFNFKNYLENRLASGVTIKKTEKWLQEDLDKFAKGKTTRAHVQILKQRLVKMQGAKNLLETKGQKDFLCKTRTCESTRESTGYLTNLHAMNGRSVENVVVENQNDEVIEGKEDNVFDFVKRKNLKDLSRSGKEYRKAQLLNKLQEGDMQLLKSKREMPNAFETLNFQKDAHCSERDIMKTEKLFKRKVGANVLAGRRLRKKASDETMPSGIYVDDFKATITLQAGLNKAAERLIQSSTIPEDKKEILMSEKMCTFYVKSGQDGTTGEYFSSVKSFSLHHHQIMFYFCGILLHYVTPCDS